MFFFTFFFFVFLGSLSSDPSVLIDDIDYNKGIKYEELKEMYNKFDIITKYFVYRPPIRYKKKLKNKNKNNTVSHSVGQISHLLHVTN